MDQSRVERLLWSFCKYLFMLVVLSGSGHPIKEKIKDAPDRNENCAFEKGEGHSLL